ncbi:pseudouridine synthase [Planomonospora sp. ID82291]|uniref:pseudouridine synthase n=1 Tax=Planomonospora sp. ID82291 TaxID=2738136 RepID=UPI0018C35C8D|nr:pseudouridine synthase [Planomonospora sp. ID82291]MBG0817485.1 pseudouridine synthase [Planomonospora sp. ID82291]
MNNRRGTPSGEGRGQSRGGAPRGGSRGGTPRGGSSSGGFRAGRGGFRSEAPRRDDRQGFESREQRGGFRSEAPRGEARGGFGADRGGSRSRYGRTGEGERGGFRSEAPRREDRQGFESREQRGGFRSEAPRGEARGGFGADRGGSRSRYGRPGEGERGGFRSEAPRREDRQGFESREQRGGFRSEAPRGEARGGFRSGWRDEREAPRRDDRGGPGRRDDREDRRSGAPRRDDRGGSRGGSGRPGRRDEVQTIGGFRADRGGRGRPSQGRPAQGGRTVPGRAPAPKAGRRPGTIENDRFKTARQPRRDSDFYDRDYVDERDTTEVPGGVRLQKVLAQAGVASRRACEELIGDGRVTVDGQVVRRFGARVDPARQVIHVDGKRLPTMPDLVYFAINKPIGVVSTMSDPEGRPSLADYVADRTERLFHVGRLDTETEGLIILTNDGELANRLTHPSYGVQKKYWAKVPGRIKPDLARRLKKGIELEDGIAKADSFALVQEHGQQALVEIVLHEGRKHIVRRMLEEVGHPVIDLARIEFGPVKLGRLKPGTVRTLTVKEVGELYAAVGL